MSFGGCSSPMSDRPAGPLSQRVRERGLAQKYGNHGQITTLMLRNIPIMYTQDLLLEELLQVNRTPDCFDFFYLPWDLQNDCNVGYAFINFRSTALAEQFIRLFANYCWERFNAQRSFAKVLPAHIQGLENNIRHLMDRAVSEAHSHYPIVLWNGERLKLGKVLAALESSKCELKAPMSAPGNLGGGHGFSQELPRRVESFGEPRFANFGRPSLGASLWNVEECGYADALASPWSLDQAGMLGWPLVDEALSNAVNLTVPQRPSDLQSKLLPPASTPGRVMSITPGGEANALVAAIETAAAAARQKALLPDIAAQQTSQVPVLPMATPAAPPGLEALQSPPTVLPATDFDSGGPFRVIETRNHDQDLMRKFFAKFG